MLKCALSWPYTEQHCCWQLLQATIFASNRPVYSQAPVAGNTQLHNYVLIIHQATLLSATNASNKVALCMAWTFINDSLHKIYFKFFIFWGNIHKTSFDFTWRFSRSRKSIMRFIFYSPSSQPCLTLVVCCLLVRWLTVT